MATGTLNMEHYGWFEVDNADCDLVTQVSGSSEDTALSSRLTGTSYPLMLRVSGYEGASANDTADTFQLQYSYDGGAATNVTTSSTHVQVYEAADGNPITDAVTATNLLTAGSGTDWNDGAVDLVDGCTRHSRSPVIQLREPRKQCRATAYTTTPRISSSPQDTLDSR